MTTLRVLLHVAAQRDYELHSLDFSTAFLQGSLHEEIWLRRPPGFTGSFPPDTQWSLRRPVYGLRQAPREWHDTLRTTLAALGFAPSTADPSLFLRTDASLPPFYILVYVDDLVFATADTAGLAHVKSELQKRHTCTDLGELRSFLGLHITRDRAQRTITLTQSHMVQQVLQRFDFTYFSPQATPLSTRHSLSALPSDESVEPSGPYPELVGCLMYLMTCTRPDLAYPLSILARYVAHGRHRPEHMATAKRVLRYLCSTSGLGLVLGGRRPVVLTGHADASWADDQATQWSSQGYTFSLGSSSVLWRSTRSSSVLGSSCEAEIYAGAMAAQELRWLTYLFTDLGEPPRSPPVLYVDNKAMLALCREHRLEHKTKHIALRYFLARELQQRGQLRLADVASEANTADIFTKALPPGDHQRFCTMLALNGCPTLSCRDVDGAPCAANPCVLLRPCNVILHKGEVTEVLIDWIRAARLQLRERFGSDFPVLRLHSDRGGEFSSDLLRALSRAEGIRQMFTLPASPQRNGIAERHIGMVMDVARTSMIHAAAPHFLWPFAVQYAAHQINLQPRVSLPETSPTLRWTGKVGDASAGAAPGGAEPGGAGSGGAEPGGAVLGGAGSGGAEPERAEPWGTASGGADPGAAGSGGVEPTRAGPGGPSGALSRRELPSPHELREWFARRWSRAARAGGAASAGGSAATRGAEAGGATGAGPGGSTSTGAAGATGPGGARTGGTRATGPARAPRAGAGGAAGVGATGGTGAGAAVSAGGPAGAGAAGGTGAGGAAGVGADAGGAGVVPAGSGGAARPRPYFVPLLEQLASPLPAPSPYAGPTGGLPERREPESRPALPVRTARTSRRVPRPLPPAVPGTHQMTLRPSTAPQRVPLPSPPASSLPALADPASDSLRAANPTVTRLLATVVTDPSFESTAVSALVTELVDFAAHCRLDFATSLVAESASICPPSVGGECALSTDVLEDRQEEFQCFATALPHLVSTLLAPEGDPDAPDIPTLRSYTEAIEDPYSSQWQAAMDAEMASWKSTGTYVDNVPPPGANIVSGMWIFRVKRPPGSPPVFKARYVARGFSQRQGVDYFQTFSPTPKMTTLWVLLHVAAQRDYELHSLDFSTTFLQGNLHEEIWLRRPPGFTGSFPPGTQWSLRRPVYGLRQAPREWHDTLRTTLAALGFAPSTADPSLFLRTDTLLPPFYILVYVDDLVFATTDTAGLAHVKSELQKRHTCTDLGELRSYLGLKITRDRARRTITLTQSHMVQQVLRRFDFTYSSPQATPLSTRHSLSALPSDESVEPSGPYPELVGCLMYLMTCTRPDLAYPLSILARYVAPGRHRLEHIAAAKRVLRYLCSTSGLGLVLGGRSPVVLTGHADASWVDDRATQRSSQGYTFSLGSSSVSWRSTRSSSVLSSSYEAEIYAGAMAAQELRWLTYLLTDLGELPRSPPVLYVDNKAMLALCREHRLEHRTKHIALRYFLARELQQRG
ncbi:unnamed protein product [Closterium sp. NIES-54]